MKNTESIKSHISDYVSELFSFISISNLESLLKSLVIMALSFLAPIKNIILSVYFLIFVDLVSGLWASKKEKLPITSSGLSRTIGKILIYSTTIVVAYVVHKHLLSDFGFPIESIVSGFIAITETKSILENMNRISSSTLIKDLILLLSNERVKRLPPKPIRNKKDE